MKFAADRAPPIGRLTGRPLACYCRRVARRTINVRRDGLPDGLYVRRAISNTPSGAVAMIRAFPTLGASLLGSLLWLAPIAAPGQDRHATETAEAPRLTGLGDYHRPITTAHLAAQQEFDRGLILLYAFNHDEAVRAFQRAAALDAQSPAAHWGLALANGPHINKIGMTEAQSQAAWQATLAAQACAERGTDVEHELVSALRARYAESPPADRAMLDRAYADAMRRIWRRFPADADVGALLAEALMDLRPWDLWTVAGQPQPETPEILEVLETVLKQSPQHPLALHLYIHAVEASTAPGRADDAADRLRRAHPGLGHLVHMPSHIDIRRGRWQSALEANQRAIAADQQYVSLVPQQNFYRIYMAHNHHMLAFAAMMRGQRAQSAAAIDDLLARIPADWLAKPEQTALADGYFAMPIEIEMRFGRWRELLARPDLPSQYPIARALRRAARGVALTALGDTTAARQEQRAFRELAQATPPEAGFGNNPAEKLFAVGDALLDGEILLRQGMTAAGLAQLRVAVEHEDLLRYDEPPDWIQPARHALGAALLRHDQPAEAERVYREDLRRWPENGWSLFGLAESLKLQGQQDEAREVFARFEQIWKDADVKLTASCFCQAGE